MTFTDEDFKLLNKALDTLKSAGEKQSKFGDMLSELKIPAQSDPVFDMLRDHFKDIVNKDRIIKEEQFERIVILQGKLMEFKQYLSRQNTPVEPMARSTN